MTETSEARLKRMRMRSWRRGTKEMDLVLGPFADTHLQALSEADLLTYDLLLEENDQDLMAWLLGPSPAPAPIAALLSRIGDLAMKRNIAGNLR
ncbi:MAG: succinate dehydrogenase assembly factor 2 [Paracoccaceae bacterium]